MNKIQALKILGLTGNPNPEDIKKAYRKLSIIHHPDKNNGSPESEEKFKQINEAYQSLTSPPDSMADLFSDIQSQSFEQLFKFFTTATSHQGRPEKKPNPSDGLDPPWEDINLGKVRLDIVKVLLREELTFEITVKTFCSSCRLADNWKSCTNCDQTGVKSERKNMGFTQVVANSQCHICKGKGWYSIRHCKQCQDSGFYFKKKTLAFLLPENYVTGQSIRLANCGHENYKKPSSSVLITPIFSFPNLSNLDDKIKKKLKDA